MKISHITSTLDDMQKLLEDQHIVSVEFDKVEFETDYTPENLEDVLAKCDILIDFIDDNVVQQILRKRMSETKAPVTFTKVTRDEFGLTVHFTHWNSDDDEQRFDVRYDENAEAYMVLATGEATPYTYLISPGDKFLVLRAMDKIAAHVKRASGLFDDLITYSDEQCTALLHYSKTSTIDPEIYGDLSIQQLLDFIFIGYTVDFIQMKPFELLPISVQEAILSLNLRENLEEKWSEQHVLYKLTEGIKLSIVQKPESVLQAISLRFDYTENLDGEVDRDFVKILTHTYYAFKSAVEKGEVTTHGPKSTAEEDIDSWIFEAMGSEACLDKYYPQMDNEAGNRGVDLMEYIRVLAFTSKYTGMQELVKVWANDPQYD